MKPSDWPKPYLPENPILNNPPDPSADWSKAEVLKAGAELAKRLIIDPTDPTFPADYRATVNDKAHPERVDEYKQLINRAYPNAFTFNSNDFANIHHVAWIMLLRAVVTLTNENIHGDWGDPPAESSFHSEPERSGEYAEWFHNTPNATGYYAVSTLDVPAANTGV
jgi:hypothetical protein